MYTNLIYDLHTLKIIINFNTQTVFNIQLIILIHNHSITVSNGIICLDLFGEKNGEACFCFVLLLILEVKRSPSHSQNENSNNLISLSIK